MAEQEPTDRRTFHLACIYGLWSLIGASLAVPAAVYLLFPPRAKKKQAWVEAADLASLPLNTPEEVVYRRNRVDGWKVISEKSTAWIVRTSDTQATAFAPQCPHLGCAYHWEERKREFHCPCHTSAFSIKGQVLSGPSSRDLDRIDVQVTGNRILLGEVRRSA